LNILEIAKQIKDEEAKTLLEHPEDFPEEWVEIARRRFE